MSNKHYVKGRKKEYKLMKQYRALGYVVLRTAGSHGFADIIVIDKSTKEIYFIQVKPDNISDTQEIKLRLENSWLNGLYKVIYRVE